MLLNGNYIVEDNTPTFNGKVFVPPVLDIERWSQIADRVQKKQDIDR